MSADPSDGLVFSPVDHAAGEHVHVHLRDRFIATINRHPRGGYLVAALRRCRAGEPAQQIIAARGSLVGHSDPAFAGDQAVPSQLDGEYPKFGG